MKRILVVEDNELNRDMLMRRLMRKGFEILVAGNGTEAVECALRDEPDLVLMDMSLPEMDGWEATRRIKAEGASRSIPIIALTAHAMADDRKKAIAAGCDDYETKPVDFARLLHKIRTFLEME